MRKFGTAIVATLVLSMPVHADTSASAQADAEVNASAETGFFARTWNAIGSLFGGESEAEVNAKAEAQAKADAEAQARVEAEAKARADAEARKEAAAKQAAAQREEAESRKAAVKASGEATVEAGKSLLKDVEGAVSTDASVKANVGVGAN